MSNIDNKTQELFASDAMQDLENESAAAVSGGIKVYTGPDFTDFVRTAKGVPDLRKVDNGSFNNTISSIINDTNQRWGFYTRANYSGQRFFLNPGQSLRRLNRTFDNAITSYTGNPAIVNRG